MTDDAKLLLRECQDYLLEHDHEFPDENPECAGCKLQEKIAAYLATPQPSVESVSVSHDRSGTEIPASAAPLHCLDCGLRYSDIALDTTLPINQWRMIRDGEGGILCANCMVRRAAKLPGIVACRMRFEFANAMTDKGASDDD